METETMPPAELDDWEVLKRFLPDGWQGQAKALGAFQRSRKVKDPESLSPLLLIHLAGDCSLRMTAPRIEDVLGAAEHFSPWGYALGNPGAPHAQPVAGNLAHG